MSVEELRAVGAACLDDAIAAGRLPAQLDDDTVSEIGRIWRRARRDRAASPPERTAKPLLRKAS